MILAMAYASADVTVIPSLEDNLPNVMLESLACGTPVVGFQTGGIKDVIKDGMNGYLVRQKDCAGLCEAINKVISSDVDMSMNCRLYAEKHFSLQRQASLYRDLYNDIRVKKRSCPLKGNFAIPVETHRVLAPYYYEAIEHVLELDLGDAAIFLLDMSLEDAVIEILISCLGKAIDYDDRTLAVWGMGGFARKLINRMLEKDADFKRKNKGFFDSKSDKETFLGYPRLDEGEIVRDGIKKLIIASVNFEDDIYEKVSSYGSEDIQVIRPKMLYESWKASIFRGFLTN